MLYKVLSDRYRGFSIIIHYISPSSIYTAIMITGVYINCLFNISDVDQQTLRIVYIVE